MASGKTFVCETCGSNFYRYPSRIRAAEAKGYKIRYCSHKCYDRRGEKNIGWSGGGLDYWRKSLIKAVGKCEYCGYDEVLGILQIHHHDRDRSNNTRENLKLLCPNCHALDHYHAKDGIFTRGEFSHLSTQEEP